MAIIWIGLSYNEVKPMSMIKFQLLSEYLQSIRLTSTEKVNELMKELKLRGLEINSWQKEMILNACDDDVKWYLEKELQDYIQHKRKENVSHLDVSKLKPKKILSRGSYKSSEDKTKPVYILDNSKRWV